MVVEVSLAFLQCTLFIAVQLLYAYALGDKNVQGDEGHVTPTETQGWANFCMIVKMHVHMLKQQWLASTFTLA